MGNDEAKSGGIVAANSTVKVEGNVTAKEVGVNANNESTVTVTGDVKGTGSEGDMEVYGTGVVANGSSTVEVGGDVTGNETGVVANGSSTVEVGKDVTGGKTGVTANGYSTVTVKGEVTATGGDGVVANDSTIEVGKDVTVTDGNGVEAYGSAVVTVKGDVKVNGNGDYGVIAHSGSTVEVEGDVTGAQTGVEVRGSTVEIGGDVAGKTEGISVIITGNDKSTIVVEGTVSGGTNISLQLTDVASQQDVIDALPEIIVQTLDPKADMVAVVGDNVDKDVIANQVLEQVKYIVDTNVNTKDVDNLIVEIYKLAEDGSRAALDAADVAGKTLTVATTGTKLVVSAKSGSLVGVSIDTDNEYNTVTYSEANRT